MMAGLNSEEGVLLAGAPALAHRMDFLKDIVMRKAVRWNFEVVYDALNGRAAARPVLLWQAEPTPYEHEYQLLTKYRISRAQ